jgi:hypothetical protein
MAVSRVFLLRFVAVLLAVAALASPLRAQTGRPPEYTPDQYYSAEEIVDAGHQFFGTVSGSLATLVERAVRSYGLPNGYIVGQEGSGAIIGGLSYGDGMLYTKLEAPRQVYWQGPSIGWDIGGDGNRTMMLVYNVPNTLAVYRRYAGISGSAYLVGGLGMTVLANNEIPDRTVYIVPIRSGVGARLGFNLGYLKFTPRPTWNPF